MSSIPILSIPFGEHKGIKTNQFILENTNGMKVKIMDYGATITAITLPDENGKDINLVCGFDTLEGYFTKDYLENAPYFGCTVGRYASRIKDGKFSINNKSYTLAVNNGSNHLHGGIVGFDKQLWQSEIKQNEGYNTLIMSLVSLHMDEGYPGRVSVKVTFSLSDDNALSIKYMASSDMSTPLSLTNHNYFNLSGFKDSIEHHIATIHSSEILEPDKTNVPDGKITSIKNTPADLTKGKILGECFKEMETGFEHYYIFKNTDRKPVPRADFYDSKSGRKLKISTTEPGALFYTGYFTSDKLKRENGDKFGKYRGLCFETSRYPNGPNIENSPGSITKRGEIFKSETIYKFSQEKIT